MTDDKEDVVTINISASSRISNEDLKIFTNDKTSRIVINDGKILHDAVLTSSSCTALDLTYLALYLNWYVTYS
eukprot:CAMPEP_0182480010 /NCGR_PEP_ID=MMETSP1319-20130603/35127_1 /TAXON_ID=172717 /ORGANISM="Bolidomonas pacifica, Strain RCC208" /LENGTH=72 /DNA_ID=CAMNT_0024681467 /DNA_START=33 /DNA_END=247 /DNA_ORIENTATION=+